MSAICTAIHARESIPWADIFERSMTPQRNVVDQYRTEPASRKISRQDNVPDTALPVVEVSSLKYESVAENLIGNGRLNPTT